MLLGAAFQRGLLPLSLHDLTESIKDNFESRTAAHNIEAFHLGRHVVLHPEKYQIEVREGFQEILQRKVRLLGSSRGATYKKMTAQFLQAWEGDEETRVQFVSRLYDLFQFDNASYAQKYLDRVLATLKKDSKDYGFAATTTVVKYLHKVMEIKDEVYVAHLLTSPEKYEKDAKRYKLDLAGGDRIEYRHFNRPQFDFLGLHIKFDLKSKDWMLRIMKHMKFLRTVMPQWHTREKDFRQWYSELVDRFEFKTHEEYSRWIRALAVPEDVKGYREIRYPKMEKAKETAGKILSGEEKPKSVTLVMKEYSHR
jgi:indolepyruvate ferredoxin oxidoreductase